MLISEKTVDMSQKKCSKVSKKPKRIQYINYERGLRHTTTAAHDSRSFHEQEMRTYFYMNTSVMKVPLKITIYKNKRFFIITYSNCIK